MAVVEGGSKCKLITGLDIGEDTDIAYGKQTQIAQTFPITAQLILWRCRVKSWAFRTGEFYHYALKATDTLGKPTGPNIATTTLSPTGESDISPGKWRRFDFDTFPELAPGTYTIICSVPTDLQPTFHRLRADTSASPYTEGKCWKSTDGGVTWTQLLYTDLMFEVWGYEPPPAPPPPPVISNWCIIKIEYYPTPGSVTIVVTTNTLCHLFMRWTIAEPQQHKIPRLRRGLFIFDDKRFCFVAYHENEQLEPGDTLVHTFIKGNWPVCQTRWFYFIGTRAGEQQPSTSPIFKYHNAAVPPPTPELLFLCYPVQNYSLSINEWWRSGATFPLPFWAILTEVDCFLARELVWDATWATASIYNTDALGRPTGAPLVEKTISIVGIPRVPIWTNKRFIFDTPVALPPNAQYILWLTTTGPYPTNSFLWRARYENVCPNTFVVQFRTDIATWYYGPDKDASFEVWGKYL